MQPEPTDSRRDPGGDAPQDLEELAQRILHGKPEELAAIAREISSDEICSLARVNWKAYKIVRDLRLAGTRGPRPMARVGGRPKVAAAEDG